VDVDVEVDVNMDLPWAPVTVAGHADRCVFARVYVCKLPESKALSTPDLRPLRYFLASDLVFRSGPCL
jgi:hypothetical protein